MCCIAFSPTLLGTTKLDFVADFRAWWCKRAVPDGFRMLTKELKHQYNDSIPPKGATVLSPYLLNH